MNISWGSVTAGLIISCDIRLLEIPRDYKVLQLWNSLEEPL